MRTRLHATVALFLVAASSCSPAPHDVTLAPAVQVPTGNMPLWVTAADVDGDDRPDLLVVNHDSATVSVLVNATDDGVTTPRFAGKVDLATDKSPYALVTADFNGDGRVDFAVCNFAADSLSVFLNTTEGPHAIATFAPRVDLPSGRGPNPIASADFDADGRPDLATIANTDSMVSVLRNTTEDGALTATFAPAVMLPVASPKPAFAVGDVNGDGKPDIVVARGFFTSGPSFFVLLDETPDGSSKLAFTSPIGSAETEADPISIGLSDIDGDGAPDIVISDFWSGTISVLLNRATRGAKTPAFGKRIDLKAGDGTQGFALADLDGDGTVDLVAANQNSQDLSLFFDTALKASTPGFARHLEAPLGITPLAVAAGDFNADARPDIAVIAPDQPSVSILMQR